MSVEDPRLHVNPSVSIPPSARVLGSKYEMQPHGELGPQPQVGTELGGNIDNSQGDSHIEISGFEATLPVPDSSIPDKSVNLGLWRRAAEAVRRNKVTAFAGAILVGSVAANPLGEGLDQLSSDTVFKVAAGMGAAEAFWIGGAAMAWKAAGGKFTVNPRRLWAAFGGLSRQAVKDNRRLFDAGVGINTTAAVAQMAIPSAAIVGSLPPSYWGLTALAGLELWATLQVRHKILRKAKG